MKIISSGQKGVDIGVLKGVEKYNKKYSDSGVSVCGYYPQGHSPSEKRNYGLREDSSPTPGFSSSKSCNIRNADEAELVIGIFGEKKNQSTYKTCWYALHGEYRDVETIYRGDIKHYKGGKDVVYIKKLSVGNFNEILSGINRVIRCSRVRSIMVKGTADSSSEEIIEDLIFETLCLIYGKVNDHN